uniref:Uncharacterized protein n=1 Tax=Erpetoichthys calabaricus TaxID=27687 RepID=A0A8C4RLC3_ERPCA
MEPSIYPFSYPLPETRFFHAGNFVYKFKIKPSECFQKWKLNEQKRNLNQINIWCDHPLPSKTASLLLGTLAHSF